MAFAPQESRIVEQAIADNSTTQKHQLGQVIRAYDSTYGEGEFIYLLGVASTTVGAFVTYSVGTGHQTKLATSVVAVSDPIAVAMAATVAAEYGWYQISGLAIGSTAGAASFAATAAFAVASGEMIVAATTNRIGGAVVAVLNKSTTSQLTVKVMLDRPHTGGGEA